MKSVISLHLQTTDENRFASKQKINLNTESNQTKPLYDDSYAQCILAPSGSVFHARGKIVIRMQQRVRFEKGVSVGELELELVTLSDILLRFKEKYSE